MSKEVLLKVKRVTPVANTETEIDLQADSNNNLMVSQGTTLAGEDLVNDVMKVEERFSLTNISSGAGTQVKTGVGLLHCIQINNAGSSWEIDVYDGTASTGTLIGKVRGTTLPTNLYFDGAFSVGLFIDTVKGTTVGDLTVSYR